MNILSTNTHLQKNTQQPFTLVMNNIKHMNINFKNQQPK